MVDNTHPFHKAFLDDKIADDVALAAEKHTALTVTSVSAVTTRFLPRVDFLHLVQGGLYFVYQRDPLNTDEHDGSTVIRDAGDTPFVLIGSIGGGSGELFSAYGDTSNSPSDRVQYDSEDEGFTFFAINENDGNGQWYVRDDDQMDGWAGPFPMGSPGPQGETGDQGPAGDQIFAQDSEPSTDNPDGSIWIDTSSGELDLYELTGSPLAWTDTGKNLRGSDGIDGASQFIRVDVVDTTGLDPDSDYEAGDAVNGVTLVENMIVLRAEPSGGSPDERHLNGPYIVPASGAASRHSSFASYDSLPGTAFRVMEGTANADTLWFVNSDKGGTLGTDPVVIEEFEGGGGGGEVGDVATLSALKALAAGAFDTVISQGYHTAGDGGGGVWRWDGSNLSTEVTNDPQSGIYAAPDSDSSGASGALVRQFVVEYDPRWFGVVMDDDTATAANTTAMQAVLDTQASSGIAIRVPAGDLYVGELEPTAPVVMKGAGIVDTNIRFDLDEASSGIFIDYAVNQVDPFGHTLEDLRIYSTGGEGAAGNHRCIRGRTDGSNRNMVHNRVWVEDFSHTAYDISDSFNNAWRDFRIRNCDDGILYRNSTFSGNTASTGDTLINGYISGCGGQAVSTVGPGTDDILFTQMINIIFENNGQPIHVRADSITDLIGCYFEANSTASELGRGTEINCRTGSGGDALNWLDKAVIIEDGAFSLYHNEDTSAAGPSFELDRERASPAGNDQLGSLRLYGRNDAGEKIEYARMQGRTQDVTDGTEDGSFRVMPCKGGSIGSELLVATGTLGLGASGGFQGGGTCNFTTVFDDGVDVTCMALQYLETGKFDDDDVAEWDAKIPDRVIPEERYERPVTQMVERETDVRDQETGKLVRRKQMQPEPVYDTEPVYDENGNAVGERRTQRMEEVVTPEQHIPRVHEGARRFKSMLDDGFDPRDPVAYIQKMKRDRALPGMPTETEFTDRQTRTADGEKNVKLSLSEMQNRMWLAVELLALGFDNHEARIAALEAGQPRS